MPDTATGTSETRPTIRDSVRESLKSLGPKTREMVIDHYANLEADKQATALIKTIDKLSEAEKTMQRMRPDLETYGDDGKVQSSGWSKAKLEERTKLQEKIDKLTKAINKADDGDFGDLYNVANKD